MATKNDQNSKGKGRGFAFMDSEKQRKISRRGGQASHRSRDKQQVGGNKNGNTGNKEE